jgi:hypothetical protein
VIKENIASDGKFDGKAVTIRRRLDWLVDKPDKIQQAARLANGVGIVGLGVGTVQRLNSFASASESVAPPLDFVTQLSLPAPNRQWSPGHVAAGT